MDGLSFLQFWGKLTLPEKWRMLKAMTQENRRKVADAIGVMADQPIQIGAKLNAMADPEMDRRRREAFR